MKKDLNLQLTPEIALDHAALEDFLRKKTGSEQVFYRKIKQSIDARNKNIKVLLNLKIDTENDIPVSFSTTFTYRFVGNKPAVIIVGAGPAGLFAALRLIELGIKPIVLERGSDVRQRRRDLAAINKEHIVNPESNYCFGEGGAGTYSDGKLYTRSKKRGDIQRILEILVLHGATEDILMDAHPHIGTNKLPQVVTALREKIMSCGGEIHFNTKVTDLFIEKNEIKGVQTADNVLWKGIGVILATGHSARDIFELLHAKKVAIENKPFAMGVRVEHPQNFVDTCQYHRKDRGLLPAASYSLVAQTYFGGIQRGVFSFCMCPGGFIVPASTAPGELVVNGMSPSRRDSKYANSGVVVSVNPPDWEKYKEEGPLAALAMQKAVEQQAWEMTSKAGGRNIQSQLAPAQLLSDFLKKRESSYLNETSYQPGLVPMDMHSVLPDFIAASLEQGIQAFQKKMRGYGTELGQMIGIESRTSSPVRIPRDKEKLEHPNIARLFPCGEGAGYAGGIVSAAMDGEKCAEAVTKWYGNN